MQEFKDPLQLTLIVPVYNEAACLDQLVDRLQRLQPAPQIIFVDDGSKDGTSERLAQLASGMRAALLTHRQNQGKGSAVRTALQNVTGQIVVIQDADFEYDPADIESLIRPIQANAADVMYGTRFALGSRTTIPRSRRRINQLLTALSNYFTGLQLSDMETCYKAFRRDVIQGVVLRENRFGIEPELTAKFARGKWRIAEVPISYTARGRADGKKIGFRDGVRAVYAIIRYAWWD
jgi:glycosyltransferase involved in cell wall biosynthesis